MPCYFKSVEEANSIENVIFGITAFVIGIVGIFLILLAFSLNQHSNSFNGFMVISILALFVVIPWGYYEIQKRKDILLKIKREKDLFFHPVQIDCVD